MRSSIACVFLGGVFLTIFFTTIMPVPLQAGQSLRGMIARSCDALFVSFSSAEERAFISRFLLHLGQGIVFVNVSSDPSIKEVKFPRTSRLWRLVRGFLRGDYIESFDFFKRKPYKTSRCEAIPTSLLPFMIGRCLNFA